MANEAVQPQSPEAWHSQSVEAVLSQLSTHHERGLSSAEAQQRLAQYGHNELREKPPTPFCWATKWRRPPSSPSSS